MLLDRYIDLAQRERGTTFVGRLGTYRYIDMDRTIDEALTAAAGILDAIDKGDTIPSFFVSPH